MSKRKVLFITPSLCQGGIEHSLITMLKLLDKTKYDLTLFTYLDDMSLLPLVPNEVRVVTDENKPHYYRKPKAIFYNVLKLASKKLKMKKFSDKIAEKLRVYIHQQKVKHPAKDIFKNEQFDVVVSYAVGICTEMALCFKNCKHYLFYHSSMDMHHDMHEKLFPQYDGIIGVSDGVKNMLCTNYPQVKNKVDVIRNYVDAQKIIEKSIDHIDVEAENKLILCTCGRLSEEKGFDLAVESAYLLKEKGVNFVWFFVSDGTERQTIEKLIDKYALNDNIVITGYLENPYPYYRVCDIYIQPSYHESFGLTIKEAVILGKAIISTDTFGGHTVLEDGKYGEIVPISAQGLADGIILALEKEKQGMYKKYDINDNIIEREIYIKKLESVLDK